MTNIALLEDDKEQALVTQDYLQQAGYTVLCFHTGSTCVRQLEKQHVDLCLLDRNVPDMTGDEVLSYLKNQLRETAPPTIFLTGCDQEQDIVAMLEAGADDYIVKPASPSIVLARIRAVLRRNGLQTVESVRHWGDMTVDFGRGEITIAQRRVSLTQQEGLLAMQLFKHVGGLVTRDHLVHVVWGLGAQVNSRSLDVHISHLRSKLNLRPETGWRLLSIYGLGYRLERIE